MDSNAILCKKEVFIYISVYGNFFFARQINYFEF